MPGMVIPATDSAGEGRAGLLEPPRPLKAGRRSKPGSGLAGRDPAPGATATDVPLELLVELRTPLPPLGPHLPLVWHMVVAGRHQRQGALHRDQDDALDRVGGTLFP